MRRRAVLTATYPVDGQEQYASMEKRCSGRARALDHSIWEISSSILRAVDDGWRTNNQPR